MNVLITYTLLLAVLGQSLAELEHISIIAPGDVPEATAEDLAKRYDRVIGFKPKVYARSSDNQFGGSSDYTLEQQKLILKAHNDFRKEVDPPASNMDEMLWSTSLASLAQQWSDNCIYEHPKGNSHPEYTGVGQNLYIKFHDRGGDNPPTPDIQPVTLWNNEDKDYRFELGSCDQGKVCGHYTQIVWASTLEVGCGITFCSSAITHSGQSYPNAWLVTCNYSPGGNYRGQKPYKSGSSCSECPDGFCKDGLCSGCDPSEPGCDCLLECQNCGTLNSQSCSCECPEGFHGVSCEKSCEDYHTFCGGNPGWPAFLCNHARMPFVKMYCPKLCGLCTPPSGSTDC